MPLETDASTAGIDREESEQHVVTVENYEDVVDGADDDGLGYNLSPYDITYYPNDFNVVTLNSYIEHGAIKMPSFQRNYVWDIKRASRWIESLLLGLPVPQLFLYERAQNTFLVVDGQQRLMTIYYYLKGRFPRMDKRGAVRRLFDQHGKVPDDALVDNGLFQDFKLKLDTAPGLKKSDYHGLSYSNLEEMRTTLDLRPVRCIVIKQNRPKDGDSSIYEIFNRLNTGGTNLTPQEIRACVYHSEFYTMLSRANSLDGWRRLFGKQEPDLHMRDIEVILRSFAMLDRGESYSTTMSRFLNDYSRDSTKNDPARNEYLERLFGSFVDSCRGLGERDFYGKKSGKFNIALFEAVFYAVCKPLVESSELVSCMVDSNKVRELADDQVFQGASSARTTNSLNVKRRLDRAVSIMGGADA